MKIKVSFSEEKSEKIKNLSIAKIASTISMICMGLGIIGVFNGNNASALNVKDSAVINPVYQRYLSDVKAGKGDNWTLIPDKYVPSHLVDGRGSDEDLPKKFSLLDN